MADNPEPNEVHEILQNIQFLEEERMISWATELIKHDPTYRNCLNAMAALAKGFDLDWKDAERYVNRAKGRLQRKAQKGKKANDGKNQVSESRG